MSADWVARAARLAADSLADGDPTGWFDRLYAAGRRGEVDMPWDRGRAHPLLEEWSRGRTPVAGSRRAVVVGCGLGHDAEHLARLGWDVVAFDISATAIETTRERHPDSAVRYVVADLLEPPAAWADGFDLVVEVFSVQSLPVSVRRRALSSVRGLVGAGGTLVVVATARNDDDPTPQGPPWPLTRTEVEAFGAGLATERLERLADTGDPADARWLAEFHRTPAPD